MKQEKIGQQWHQLDHMQIICTLLPLADLGGWGGPCPPRAVAQSKISRCKEQEIAKSAS